MKSVLSICHPPCKMGTPRTVSIDFGRRNFQIVNDILKVLGSASVILYLSEDPRSSLQTFVQA